MRQLTPDQLGALRHQLGTSVFHILTGSFFTVAGCLYHGLSLPGPFDLRATVLALLCLQFLVYLFIGDAAARPAACSFHVRTCWGVFVLVTSAGFIIVTPAFFHFRPLPRDGYSMLLLLSGIFGALAIRTLVACVQLKQDAVTRKSR